MREAVIAVTNDRSILGTMNDFSHMLKWRLECEPDADLVEAALWLSATPVGPLGHDRPCDVALRLLEAGSASVLPRVHSPTITVDDSVAPSPTHGPPDEPDQPNDRARTGNTWITDMRHFLDESGSMPDMPGPALNLALFLGSIVAWVTSGRAAADIRTNVSCRRSPAHQRCRGLIEAGLTENGTAVEWWCPVCGDDGVTRGWEGTPWDRR